MMLLVTFVARTVHCSNNSYLCFATDAIVIAIVVVVTLTMAAHCSGCGLPEKRGTVWL